MIILHRRFPSQLHRQLVPAAVAASDQAMPSGCTMRHGVAQLKELHPFIEENIPDSWPGIHPKHRHATSTNHGHCSTTERQARGQLSSALGSA
jgi:hypothetical protein